MHPALIKASLEIAGYTQAAVAQDCDVSDTVVRQVINSKTRSARVENRISRVIQLRKNQIWPQWYDEKGNPIRRRRASNPNALDDVIKFAAGLGK